MRKTDPEVAIFKIETGPEQTYIYIKLEVCLFVCPKLNHLRTAESNELKFSGIIRVVFGKVLSYISNFLIYKTQSLFVCLFVCPKLHHLRTAESNELKFSGIIRTVFGKVLSYISNFSVNLEDSFGL